MRIHFNCNWGSASILFFCILIAGCRHSTDNGLAHVTLVTDWYPQPEHGGFYTALLKGYYKAEGLDVTIQPGGPYVSPQQLVAVNSAQFGMSTSDHMLESVGNGDPLIAVVATMQHDPQGIMVHADSPVRSFADLGGHSVAIEPGSTWFEYLVKHYHLKDVHEIPATFSVANFVQDPQYIQQAFATSETFFARQAGAQERFLLVSGTGYDPYRVTFTSRQFLEQHPELVGRFVRASIKGWKEYLRDPAAANAEIARLNPAMNPAWEEFSWRALKDGNFITGDDPSGAQVGQYDPVRWTTMYNQLSDLKVITHPFDPATAYTLQFLQKK